MNTFTPYSVTAGVLQLALLSEFNGSTFDTTISTVLRLSHLISLIIILPSAYLYTEQEMQVKPSRHTVPLSRNHCCRGKAISIANSECVSVALLIQHANHMHHLFVCSLSLPYFVRLPYKGRDFRGKKYM